MLAKFKEFSKVQKIFAIAFLAGVLTAIIGGLVIYKWVFASNVQDRDNAHIIYIPTGSDYEDVVNILVQKNVIVDINSFKWVAEKKQYNRLVKPGRYRFEAGASNNEIVNILRSGNQYPVELTFNNVIDIYQLAGKVSDYLESDSLSFINYFRDSATLVKYKFDSCNFIAMFVPNTYNFNWNTTPKGFVERMHVEYQKFWEGKRIRKAEKIGLTPVQIMIIASIVEKETVKADEMPIIAGVYINRYKMGMKLDADPTLKFAWKDFSIKRVLNKHKKIRSPYNTYKYVGLPPGPIYMPSQTAIEAVLNYKVHDYLYFCAKPDFSGYHQFAKNLSGHTKNARLYQQELNKKKIFK